MRLKSALAVCLAALALAPAAPAQTVTLQTYSNSITWGGAKNPASTGVSDVIRNVSQASHIIEFCASATSSASASAHMVASFDDGATWLQISREVTLTNPGTGACVPIQTGGYYPEIALYYDAVSGSPTVYAYYSGSTAPLNLTYPVDYCQSPGVIKYSAVINLSAAGTTRVIAAPFASQPYAVCDVNFTLAGTSPTVQFIAGLGTNCATNPNNLTGAYAPASGAYLNIQAGGATLFQPETANGFTGDFCVTLGGTTPSMQGEIVYATGSGGQSQ